MTSPGRVGGEEPVGDVDLARGVDTTYGHPGQLHGTPDPGREVTGLFLDQSHHLGADHTAPENCHPQRLLALIHLAPTSVANKSSSVSRLSTARAMPSRTAITGGRSAWL